MPSTMPLHIVKTAQVARKRARATDPKPACMLQCHRCGGREVIFTRIGATYKGGKVSGGTKQVLCAGCMMLGDRVVLA